MAEDAQSENILRIERDAFGVYTAYSSVVCCFVGRDTSWFLVLTEF